MVFGNSQTNNDHTKDAQRSGFFWFSFFSFSTAATAEGAEV